MTAPTATTVNRLTAEVGAFIAKRATARRDLPALYGRGDLLDGFVRFCRSELGVELWSAQVAMAANILRAPRSVVVSGHSTGKDFLAACFMLWWVFCYRGRCIVTGPTDRQVCGITLALTWRLLLAAPALGGELFRTELRIDEVPVIIGFTSDTGSRLTGWHHPRQLMVMSEGQGCSPEAYDAMAANNTSPENRVVVFGNPTSPTGPFYTAAHSAQWACLTVPVTDHPNIVTGRMEIPGGPSREWVEFIDREYGPTSAIYGSKVLALFPSEAIESITTRALLEAAFLRHETPSPESVAALARPVVGAWDCALRGNDLNAVAVVQGTIIRELCTWRGADMTANYDRVEQIVTAAADQWRTSAHRQRLRNANARGEPLPRPALVIDEAGMGGPAVDEMRRRGYPIVGFIGAAAPLSALAGGVGRYANKRAEAYFLFRLALERGTVALPRSEALVEEALATQWQINAQDKIQIIAKDEVRRTLGRSPDLLDAVTMGLWNTLAAATRGEWGTTEFRLGG